MEDLFNFDISPLSSPVRSRAGVWLPPERRPLTSDNQEFSSFVRRRWRKLWRSVKRRGDLFPPHFLRSQSEARRAGGGGGGAAHLRASREKTDAARPPPSRHLYLVLFGSRCSKHRSVYLSSILIFRLVAVCCSTNSKNRRLQSFSSCFRRFVKTNDVWIGSLTRTKLQISTEDECERGALQTEEDRWENEEKQHDVMNINIKTTDKYKTRLNKSLYTSSKLPIMPL